MTFVATSKAVARRAACRSSSTSRSRPQPRSRRRGPPSAAHGGLMPVHLFGQLADMDALAGDRRTDRARSSRTPPGPRRGARRAPRRRLGPAAAFSFYPGKNLGAMGDAGALVDRRPELAARVRALREHGQRAKYHHEIVGCTARLDTLQALVLSRKLPHLDGVERGAAERGASLPRRARRASATSRLPPVARDSARLAPLRRPHRAIPSGSADPPPRARHLDRPALPAAGAPDRRTRRSATRGRVPGRRALGPRVPVAADLPGDDRGAARGGRRRGVRRGSFGG